MATEGNQVPLRQKPRKKTQGFFNMSRRRISCKDLGHADCQGWLYKKKEKGTFLSNKWKKFWVVLKGSSLYWYSNQMAAQWASSSSPKRRETSCSFSSLENTVKAPSQFSSSGSKERQSWHNIVNSSPATEDAGLPLTFAEQVHTLAFSEASNCQAPENNCITSEGGLLNLLSSDDTSSLNNNKDHLTVPDRAAGSRMADREEIKSSEDDEMEKLYKSLEQASLSPLGDRRPSTKKELRKSFVKRCKNPSINEKLHKIRTLNSTLKCKEHDLAMINQLLDDPKLTARKYREWKVMNTLLIQDIYQQQAPQDPEVTPQEVMNPTSSDCVENSL